MSLLYRVCVWFWGEWDEMMLTFAALVVVDFLSSVLLAVTNDSTKKNCKQWIAKRITLFLIVGVGNIIDCNLTSTSNIEFRRTMVLFFVGYEGTEILKNSKALGLPIPDRLYQFFLKLFTGPGSSTQ